MCITSQFPTASLYCELLWKHIIQSNYILSYKCAKWKWGHAEPWQGNEETKQAWRFCLKHILYSSQTCLMDLFGYPIFRVWKRALYMYTYTLYSKATSAQNKLHLSSMFAVIFARLWVCYGCKWFFRLLLIQTTSNLSFLCWAGF